QQRAGADRGGAGVAGAAVGGQGQRAGADLGQAARPGEGAVDRQRSGGHVDLVGSRQRQGEVGRAEGVTTDLVVDVGLARGGPGEVEGDAAGGTANDVITSRAGELDLIDVEAVQVVGDLELRRGIREDQDDGPALAVDRVAARGPVAVQ